MSSYVVSIFYLECISTFIVERKKQFARWIRTPARRKAVIIVSQDESVKPVGLLICDHKTFYISHKPLKLAHIWFPGDVVYDHVYHCDSYRNANERHIFLRIYYYIIKFNFQQPELTATANRNKMTLVCSNVRRQCFETTPNYQQLQPHYSGTVYFCAWKLPSWPLGILCLSSSIGFEMLEKDGCCVWLPSSVRRHTGTCLTSALWCGL